MRVVALIIGGVAALALVVSGCLLAVSVVKGPPVPSALERQHLSLLERIAPSPGATSDPARTVNDSGERESVRWVTERFDHLASHTTLSGTLRHYRRAVRAAGWHSEPVGSDDPSRTYISGRRGGTWIAVQVPHDVTQPIRVSVH